MGNSDNFFEKADKPKYHSDKVVEGAFLEPDEIIEADGAEQSQQNFRTNFSKVQQLKNPLLLRFFSFLIFAIVMLFAFFSLLFLGFTLIKGALLYVGQQKAWVEPIKRAWAYFRRTLIVLLASLVGIFNPQFGILIFMVYFSVIEPIPAIVEDFMSKL